MTTQDLLAAVKSIQPLIEAHAAEAEANRQLSSVVYDAMYRANLFAMSAPRARGGLELHPVESMQVWEAIARIDSAAAWNLVMNQGIAAYAAWLPAEGADDLFSQGVPTIAGALFPSGQAIRVAGGWRVTGQVSFGSGCQNAQWLVMPMIEMANDQPKHNPETGQPSPFGVFFPKSDAKILDTWHTYGMRGSGSTDYAVQDLFVPEHLAAPVAPLRHPAPGFEGPLYRIWPWSAIIGEGTVLIGAAAAAVDAAVHLCRTKTAAYTSMPLREQQLVQFQVGKAKARVDAARDTLHRAATDAYDDVAQSNTTLSPEAKIRIQLATCFVAEACAEAVRLVNDAVGTSSIRIGQPFERHFRDVHVLLQHSDKSSPRYASAGRLMFGLENDWVWLSF